MKKFLSIFTTIVMLTLLIFTGNTYAVALDTLEVETSNTTVRPGEEVTVTIKFGQELGAYTFDIAYDNNIFEYVSAEGGTPNDTSDKVIVVFHDETGGTNPRTNMSVTFRAKADITTSNPTEFTVTGSGLSNADVSETYDDITTPIVKNVTVEPEYVDYTIKLEYTGDVIKEEEKEMTLSYSSPMGHYYEHARLIAEATTPEGADVNLLATDEEGLEHDIIQSGWGDAQGYSIGGKDVLQELQTRATFSEAGTYTITLKLIDRDDSDQVIAENTVEISVLSEAGEITEPETEPETEPKTEIETPEEEVTETEKVEEEPTSLPKTGENIYAIAIIALILLLGSYVVYNRKK